MAILYKKHLVLSVGLSSQTGHQLELNKPLLDAMMGEDGQLRRTPLDLLMAGPREMARALTQRRYFPEEARELTHIARDRRYYWKRGGIWYLQLNDGVANFQQHRERFAKTAARLQSYRERSVLAIWSNAQENLNSLGLMPEVEITARQRDLDALHTALCGMFARAKLFAVARPDRIDPTDPLDAKTRALYYADDPAGFWRGDRDVWADALSQAFDKTGFADRRAKDQKHAAG